VTCRRCQRPEFDGDGLCEKCLLFDLKSECNQARGCQTQAEIYATERGLPLQAGRFMAYAQHRWSDAAFILLRVLLHRRA
jgi:hypothetical protein